MKKFGKGLVAMLLLTGLVAMFGCALVQDAVVPLNIEQEAIEYSGQEPTSWVPWTTLYDGNRILEWIEFNHLQYQLACDRMKEDDKLIHGKIVGRLNVSIDQADSFKSKVFSPDGAIAMAFPMLFGGAFGALFIKRPGDKSKNDKSNS